MIVAKRKPFDELKEMIKPYKKVLTVGCGTCVSVCLAGGEKEVAVLNAELDMARKLDDNPIELGAVTLERQCDQEYLAELDDVIGDYDAVVSMACGVGIQFLAERFPEKPVFPGVDTTGLAVNQDVGFYEERCRSCGACVLGMTGGICPVTMCAKGLYNGPCGGTNKGKCEISQDQPCAWFMIYDRLSQQGRLDLMTGYKEPVDWLDQVPRMTIQPGYKKPEEEEKS
jgi:ferredoxin